MNPLNIIEIEKKLGKKIRRDCISIGWDVAEANTGCCCLRVNKKEIEILSLDKITTNPKDDVKHRLDYFVMELDKYKQSLPEKKEWRLNIIEDSFLGPSVWCLKNLVRFSTAIYLTFKNCVDYQDFLTAIQVRSRIGFNQKHEENVQNLKKEFFTRGKNKGKPKKTDLKVLVKGYLKRQFGVEIEDSDKSDAFCLALAGLLM
jgi:Holliday junction resolvasome RuvABC endonuclease subunit